MIIDAHVHAYPERVISDPEGFAATHGEKHWAELVCPVNRKSLQGWATCDEMREDERLGIVDHQVLLGWYWEGRGATDLCNEYYLDLIQKYPSSFTAFMSLPQKDDKSIDLDEVERLLQLGFKGVGEVHLGVQQLKQAGESWFTLLELLAKNNFPINFHVTESLGRPHPGRVETPFEDILEVAKEFPALKMILSHLGASIPFYFLNPYVRKQMNNVYFDTAAIPLLYDLSSIEAVQSLVGEDKVIFGSDYPLKIHPRESKKESRKSFIEQLMNKETLFENEHFWSKTAKCLLST